MADWLVDLENTGLATWLRESGSIWAYPLILTLHTAGMGILVGVNWTLDLRMLGAGASVPLAPLEKLFRPMWIGFWINLLTGVMLFAADASTKGSTRLFVVKLVLVAVAVAAAMQMRRSVYPPGRAPEVGTTAKALALTSIALWLAAITAGRMMAYI
jgi:VanZ family protein